MRIEDFEERLEMIKMQGGFDKIKTFLYISLVYLNSNKIKDAETEKFIKNELYAFIDFMLGDIIAKAEKCNVEYVHEVETLQDKFRELIGKDECLREIEWKTTSTLAYKNIIKDELLPFIENHVPWKCKELEEIVGILQEVLSFLRERFS